MYDYYGSCVKTLVTDEEEEDEFISKTITEIANKTLDKHEEDDDDYQYTGIKVKKG
jgi:hypothetical protein